MTGGLHDRNEVHAPPSPIRDARVPEVVKPEVLDLGLLARLLMHPLDVLDRCTIGCPTRRKEIFECVPLFFFVPLRP